MSNERRPKQQFVRLDDLRSNTATVTRLASRPGGVRVVDDDGNERFRLSIPSARLPE
jgi:hypothetical protein